MFELMVRLWGRGMRCMVPARWQWLFLATSDRARQAADLLLACPDPDRFANRLSIIVRHRPVIGNSAAVHYVVVEVGAIDGRRDGCWHDGQQLRWPTIGRLR